jgi:hypothetical protein
MPRNLLATAPRTSNPDYTPRAVIDGVTYEGNAALAAVRNYQLSAEVFENPPLDLTALEKQWAQGTLSAEEEVILFQALLDQKVLARRPWAYRRRAGELWLDGLLTDLGGRRRQPEVN